MKSQFSKKFNHDPIATSYDQHVKNEDNPIRTGYQELLNWVKIKTEKSKVIVDLGCGTGNTIAAISSFKKAYCVDISDNMLDIAREKLSNKNIIFIKNDLLDFFSDNKNKYDIDTVISTYAIHHLTQSEKHKLFELVYKFLDKGGEFVFGDLMFKDKKQEIEMKEKYPDYVDYFDDELYWYVDDEVNKLVELGFNSIEIKRFSDLSWGIYGKK